MKSDSKIILRRFVPCYVDHYQSATYRHTFTVLYDDGSLMAQFADGHEYPSVYATVDEMLKAGENNYHERVREL